MRNAHKTVAGKSARPSVPAFRHFCVYCTLEKPPYSTSPLGTLVRQFAVLSRLPNLTRGSSFIFFTLFSHFCFPFYVFCFSHFRATRHFHAIPPLGRKTLLFIFFCNTFFIILEAFSQPPKPPPPPDNCKVFPSVEIIFCHHVIISVFF